MLAVHEGSAIETFLPQNGEERCRLIASCLRELTFLAAVVGEAATKLDLDAVANKLSGTERDSIVERSAAAIRLLEAMMETLRRVGQQPSPQLLDPPASGKHWTPSRSGRQAS